MDANRIGETVARESSPWLFPVCYLGWAYLWWAPVVASDQSVWSVPNVLLFGVGGLSPLLAGLALCWRSQGRSGLADLRRRLLEVGRVGPGWWLVIVLYWPAFNVVMSGAALALGVTDAPLEFAFDRVFDPGALVALVGFAVLFPTVEEIGLRGYWLDELQARYSALISALLLGTVWALWHVPLPLMTGYYAGTTFQPELWWWLPDMVFTAVLANWVYNNTRRSVLAVIAFHAAGNLRGELLGFAPEMYPFVVVGTILAAVLVVVGWGPRSLRGWGVPRPSPD